MTKPLRLPLPRNDAERGYAPIVAAIGSAAAVELFLKFGGATIYVPDQPQPGSRLVLTIGAPGVAALRRELGRGHLTVPLANAWVARQLAARGVGRAEMCRLMRVSRTSLKTYLADPAAMTVAAGRPARASTGGASAHA